MTGPRHARTIMTAARPWTVSLAPCPGYDQQAVRTAVNAALAALGGIGAFVSPGQRVLLKVNLLAGAPPERAVTTHPEVVRALIHMVREAGAIPFVADSPGGPNTPGLVRRVFEETGMRAVCSEEQVELVALDDETVRVPSPGGALYGAFTLGRAVVDADVVITVPKLKTHAFMLMTGAVKNLFGCVPGLEKARFHLKVPDRDDFATMLIDLMLACRPTLAVMDAVVGMDGDGPAGGRPREVGAILASPDPVALDVMAARLVGIEPSRVYTNRAAARRGLGPPDVFAIEVAGTDWRRLAPEPFVLPARDPTARLPRWLARGLRGHLTARPRLDRPELCTGCRMCERTCPVEAVRVTDDGPRFDRARCIRCYCCQELCPPQCIGLTVPLAARLMGPGPAGRGARP